MSNGMNGEDNQAADTGHRFLMSSCFQEPISRTHYVNEGEVSTTETIKKLFIDKPFFAE
jgi:hypothetical protein